LFFIFSFINSLFRVEYIGRFPQPQLLLVQITGIFSNILNPTLIIFEKLIDSLLVNTSYHSILGIIIPLIISLIYWYLISCLVIYIYHKINK